MTDAVPQLSSKRRWSWVFLLVLVLGVWISGCASAPTAREKLEARQRYNDVQKYNTLDMRDRYYEELKEIIETVPDDPFYRVALGAAYFQDRKLKKAEQEFLKAIRMDPEYMSTYQHLGRLYMEMGKWDRAIVYLQKSLDATRVLRPQQLYNWLAFSYYQNKQFTQAQRTWQKALDIKDNDQIRVNLALAYKKADQNELAFKSLQKAVEMNSKSARAHFELGKLLFEQGDYSRARAYLQEAINLEPLGKDARIAKIMLDKIQVKSQ